MIYDDMIDMPHPVSKKHPQMPLSTRAAQFLPFAALTGYDEALKETARLTDDRVELDEMRKIELNEKLLLLQECLPQKPAVRITYFKKDSKKDGGTYVTAAGSMKKIDAFENKICLTDNTRIPINDIVELDSDMFAVFDD